MATGDVKTTAARQAQSAADKQSVRDKLMGKARRTKDITIYVDGEAIEMHFEAISAKEMDRLRAEHKPTAKQISEGMSINAETYVPALVHATLKEPDLSLADVKALWASDVWSDGELNVLFQAAQGVCSEGFNLPSNASV